jgi:glycosyltransferase involved in cell wall biosynthesis
VKLLFFSPHYGTLGGVRSIVDALAAAARAAGHEVSAIVDRGGSGTFGRGNELLLYPFPTRARDLRRLRRFAQKFPLRAVRLVSAVRAAAPHVVSVHCTRRFAPYVALLRHATGVPHVLSLQEGALPPGMPENPGLFRLLVRTADAVAACSREAAAYATRAGRARRVAVLPNGYDPAEFRPGPPFPHPRPYLLGLGRLEPQKGFDLLLEALARPEAPTVDLLLAGDGAARSELEALARARGLAGRVRFLGATDRPTTLALLRGAAAVACPSRFEGLPLVCLEALAAGRPVVAAAVNGIPELVREGETGFLVPPEDPAALGAALARVVAAPEAAARVAARGQALVEQLHPWSVVAPAYLALSAEVAGLRAARAAA